MHGRGKDYSPNWWKALGGLLIAHGTIADLSIQLVIIASHMNYEAALFKIVGSPCTKPILLLPFP